MPTMLMLPDYRVRQRDFLLEISRAMTAQLDLGEVLRLVLNASVAMLGGQAGLVALRDAQDNFSIRATIGVDGEKLPDLNQQLHELLINTGKGLDNDFLNIKLSQMAVSLDRRLRQSLFLPLIIAKEPVGLLIVFRSYRAADATENDVQVLQSFADQAAIAVHNAQLYARMEHERGSLAAIVDHSADGVMILDHDLRIERFNRALERMTAWTSADAIGQFEDEVFQWKRLEKDSLRDALAEGWPFRSLPEKPREVLYVEGDLLRRDGLTLSVGITYAPLITADKLVGIIANVRDITNFRKAQEMQNTFISTISHELKTPVALIKGYAGTLRREDADWDPHVIRDSLAVIEDEADRLTHLIENLLTASKLKAEQMRMDLGDVRLDLLAAQVVERFTTQTQVHQLRLSFPPDFPIALGDEIRLRQVLDNLISNAIKYSPNGGQIIVGGEFDDKMVTVYVQDQGVGLAEQDRARVFDRFFRVDSTLSRRTQGTGLGLYLSKAIIDAHNGIIDVISKPGQGAKFYFSLPRN